MSIGIGTRSLLLTQSLVGMRSQMVDLQRQFATGKRSDDYAGIGLNRGLTVSLRSQLAATSSYGDTITNLNVRIDLAESVLSRIGQIGMETKNSVATMTSEEGRINAQSSAKSAVGEMLGLLNTSAGDRYIFSGLATDTPSVESLDMIMDGDAAHAGFSQIVSERLQADIGASGLGRLVVAAPTPGAVSIAEDAAGSVFGFKLNAISSTLSGSTVSGPAATPPAAPELSIDLGGVNPASGEKVSFTFDLPDGSKETITLTATTTVPPGPNEFAIGQDSATTAANLQTKLQSSIGTLARTSLTAASALAAADNFFNTDAANPPLRVDGPPFDTATGLVAGSASNTVMWYTGEAGSQPARTTAAARVDQSITVNYGLRANEEGIRWQLQNVAALAAMSMGPTDPDSEGRAAAMASRLRTALDVPQGTQSTADIRTELAGAQKSIDSARQRHQYTNATLSDFLEGVEGISNEEVAAKMLALQTSLQASMQTTARLFQMSILNYM